MIFNRIILHDTYPTGWHSLLVEFDNENGGMENIWLQFDHDPDAEELQTAADRSAQKVVTHHWMEDTALRIFFSYQVITNMLLTSKPLVDLVFNSGLTVEQVDGGSYVYLNYILPEHLGIIQAAGGVVETNEN